MKKLKLISGLLAVTIQLPIWMYLLYKLLQAVNASELMWFLYWVYLPVGVVTLFLARFVEDNKE